MVVHFKGLLKDPTYIGNIGSVVCFGYTSQAFEERFTEIHFMNKVLTAIVSFKLYHKNRRCIMSLRRQFSDHITSVIS